MDAALVRVARIGFFCIQLCTQHAHLCNPVAEVGVEQAYGDLKRIDTPHSQLAAVGMVSKQWHPEDALIEQEEAMCYKFLIIWIPGQYPSKL